MTGPWRVKPEPSNTIGCRTIQGPKSGSHKQAQHTDIAYTVGLRNDELDKANANLLAAAPELLAALKQAREDIIDLVGIATEMLNICGPEVDPAERTYGPAVARIETAIAKATGGTA